MIDQVAASYAHDRLLRAQADLRRRMDVALQVASTRDEQDLSNSAYYDRILQSLLALGYDYGALVRDWRWRGLSVGESR